MALLLPLITFTDIVTIPYIPQQNMVAVSDVLPMEQKKSAMIPWTLVIMVSYVLGVLFFGTRLLLQLVTLHKLKSVSNVSVEHPFHHVKTKKPVAPFSFFNYIFYYPKGFTPKELHTIILHEKAHATQKHSLDILAIELLFILQWFNPFVWAYKNQLKENLEFLADKASQSTDRKFYQMLLLKEAVGVSNIPLSTSFYNSIIKKRIVMLNQKRSKKISLAKSLIVLPVLGLFLMAFNTKTVYEVADVQSNTLELIIDKNTTNQELESIKKDFIEKKIDFSYTAVRNEKGEIIDLALDMNDAASTTSNNINGSYKTKSDGPITPVTISLNSKTNSLFIGNLKNNATSTSSPTMSRELTEIKIELDKNSKAETYEKNSKFLVEKGMKIDFKGVKRNSNNEIVAIKVTYDNGAGQKGSYVRKSAEPIKPFIITIKFNDNQPGDISIWQKGKKEVNSVVVTEYEIKTGNASIQENNKVKVIVHESDSYGGTAASTPIRTTVTRLKIKTDGDTKVILLDDKEITMEDLEAKGAVEKQFIKAVHVINSNDSLFGKTTIEALSFEDDEGNEQKVVRVETDEENESQYIIIKQKGEKNQSTVDLHEDIIAIAGKVKFSDVQNDDEKEKPLLFVDGKKLPYKGMSNLNPNDIKTISVLKGKAAIESHGKEAKHGVIIVTTKKEE